MNQQAWETAMGMGGYRGSPAERDDRKQGIVIGGRVMWGVLGDAIPATITAITIDEAGDPRFTLTIEDADYQKYVAPFSQHLAEAELKDEWHKDITVDRDEIFPLEI